MRSQIRSLTPSSSPLEACLTECKTSLAPNLGPLSGRRWRLRSPPGGDVIFYDGTGTAAGLNGAHTLAAAGTSLIYVTPDNTAGAEVSYIERPLQMRAFYKSGASLHPDLTLRRVARDENRLRLSFENSYSGETIEMSCDTLIYEHGTLAS